MTTFSTNNDLSKIYIQYYGTDIIISIDDSGLIMVKYYCMNGDIDEILVENEEELYECRYVEEAFVALNNCTNRANVDQAIANILGA